VGPLLALVLLASGCWHDDGSEPPPAVRLPFSLQQVAGTTPVGRPAVYDGVTLAFKGRPVVMKQLRVAYRVTSDEPEAVFRQWLAQLAALRLGKIGLEVGGGPGRWLKASAYGPYQPDQPPTGWAELALWRAEDAPYLLLTVARRADATPGAAAVPPSVPSSSAPPAVPDTRRQAGDVLFVEQRQEMHLPPGTRDLMPVHPTPSGTGGSTSVLAAADARAATKALLDEARALSSAGEVRGPTTTTQDGVRVVEASFDIAAGGWGFHVVSAQGADDDVATLWVTSSAD
jgi:hypothetical protein